ncbi:hypothetical protein [Paenibacillus flagellatus]|uniref:Bacteriophage SP-beta YorD domain-containing protein n=1 Tax=Paenibacillus flagellatus TaxID=2211139 RepID=A0A2V5K3W1_9BACL|nr:hypothetical protein [Paenibacillus flagellatus]PYI52554.1 hypothetical protein DLM86_20490 [Paenibacillus flagellatus]
MKEAYKIGLDGQFIEPELVPFDTEGVAEIYETPAPTEETPEPEPVLIGYRVAVPLPPGLYKPRFNLASGEWAEGLAPEEIEAIRQASQPPPSLADQLSQLQRENESIMLALAELYESFGQGSPVTEKGSLFATLSQKWKALR